MESPDWIHLWPTTRGTYRISGLADTAVGEQPWSVVLKIVGAVDLPGHHEPTDPFYWKREPMALSSVLLQDWPGPFAPVRCWAVDDVAEDESWVWLECLESGDTKRRWSPREHAAAAFDLGVFNGQWLGRTAELENVDWLARRWLRAWVDLASVWGADRVAQDAACWEHPLIAACVPAATRAAIPRPAPRRARAADRVGVLAGRSRPSRSPVAQPVRCGPEQAGATWGADGGDRLVVRGARSSRCGSGISGRLRHRTSGRAAGGGRRPCSGDDVGLPGGAAAPWLVRRRARRAVRPGGDGGTADGALVRGGDQLAGRHLDRGGRRPRPLARAPGSTAWDQRARVDVRLGQTTSPSCSTWATRLAASPPKSSDKSLGGRDLGR